MKTRFFSLFVALIATMSVFAYDFQSGDLYYNITSNSTVEVTYEGEWPYQYSGLTSAVIPKSVTYDGTTYSVTSIGDRAFRSCSSLTSITIPNSVTSIGDYAFYHCTDLTSVTIPNSVTSIGAGAFSDCTGLTSITIPNSVTSIGESAFDGCTGLTSVTIPNSVTSIGEKAFWYCTGLTSVTIPNSVTSIGDGAFGNVPNIAYSGTATGAPWGARNMNGYVDGYLVYSDATRKTILACSTAATGAISIPNSVTSIGAGAFSDCTGLTSITIPNNVTTIEGDAFNGCTGLTSVAIPNSVTSIGLGTFKYCTSLMSVTIPNSVTSIEEDAFKYCFGLTSITIPNSVTSIGEEAFGNVPNIVYSGTATGAPWGARSMNGYVEGYLVYSDSKKTTLLACSSAATGSISIPNSVTSIEDNAFWYCTGLTSVTIGNSVTRIGYGAFASCTGLTSVTCYAVEPPTTAWTWERVDSIPLYVPIESIEKYRVAEEWKDFKEILPISAMPVDAGESVINPESTTVTITWPATDKAATYTIEISKDGTLVCTLTFDANGVLQNMRFAAPARHATQHTTQAETTGSGFRFVVGGLDYATTYTYTITAKDTEDKVVESYNGTFTTTAPTSTEDVHSTPSQPAVRKVFRNGQVYILRGDKIYSLTGEEL